jgi:uncharacterized membrane protein
MSTDELVSTPTPSESGRRRVRTRWWRRPWVAPLAVVAVGFLIYALPPYLSLDPAQARLQPGPDSPWFYPLLVTHIFLGSVAILCATVQVWPWLRRTHPRMHRITGRIYVAAVLPAAVCVAIIAPMTIYGLNARVANTMLALLWFGTTAAGFVTARRRQFGQHRVWMLRSFALTFSIVANRVWTMVILILFVPGIITGVDVDEVLLHQAIGVATWTSWVVNLLIVEWWLHRPTSPRAAVDRRLAVEGQVVEGRAIGR